MFDGLKHTDETRQKMSESAKRIWEQRKMERTADSNDINYTKTDPEKISYNNNKACYQSLAEPKKIDMQKIKIRADIERLIYNYVLMGKIENETAVRIVSFIDEAIGGGNLQGTKGKIIDFPKKNNQ